MDRRTFFRYGTLAYSLIAFLCATAATARAQNVQYAPTVGQVYEYGIEIRLVNKPEKNVRPFNFSQRCRVQYEITHADATGWTARYSSIPFQNGAPVTDANAYKVSLERKRSIASGDPALNPPVPNLQGAGAELAKNAIARSRAIARSQNEMFIDNVDNFPGLLNFCEGDISVSNDGEVTRVTGKAALPMLAGHLARIPIVRLPTGDNQASAFGHKSLVNILLLDPQQKTFSTEGSILTSAKPRKASLADLIAFDVSIEEAGGASIGAQVKMSGEGFYEFSKKANMPYAGNIDYKCSGITFGDASSDLDMRIGFHILDPWRRLVFDLGVVPTEEAMSAKFMPRLTDGDCTSLRRQLTSGERVIERAMYDKLAVSAPPPFSQGLDALLKSTIENFRDKITSIKNMDDEARHQRAAGRRIPPPWVQQTEYEIYVKTLQHVAKRWHGIRQAASMMTRTWTDSSGSFKVPARLAASTETTATLRRLDSQQTIDIPISRLSEADVDFVKAFGRPADASSDQ